MAISVGANGVIFGASGVFYGCCCGASGPTPPTICSCTLPATFDIQGTGFSNSSCSSCSLFNVRKPVTYTGITNCGGTDFNIWESVDDVYGSPGVCSGDFDNRKLYLLVDAAACTMILKLRATGDGECSNYDASDPIRADSPFAVAIPGSCSGSIDLAPFGITWSGGLQCNPGTWLAHPFGT